MEIKKYNVVENIHGESHKITLIKQTTIEEFEEYGYYPYRIKIENTNPHAFDFNNHIFLYDYWQTAYKRFRELEEEYRTIEILIVRDVDAMTGRFFEK